MTDCLLKRYSVNVIKLLNSSNHQEKLVRDKIKQLLNEGSILQGGAKVAIVGRHPAQLTSEFINRFVFFHAQVVKLALQTLQTGLLYSICSKVPRLEAVPNLLGCFLHCDLQKHVLRNGLEQVYPRHLVLLWIHCRSGH